MKLTDVANFTIELETESSLEKSRVEEWMKRGGTFYIKSRDILEDGKYNITLMLKEDVKECPKP
jgi:hypothetical protein